MAKISTCWSTQWKCDWNIKCMWEHVQKRCSKHVRCLTTALRSHPFTASPSEPAVSACDLNPVCRWFSPQTHNWSNCHTWDSQWPCRHMTTPVSTHAFQTPIPLFKSYFTPSRPFLVNFLDVSLQSGESATALYALLLTYWQLLYEVEVKLIEPEDKSIELDCLQIQKPLMFICNLVPRPFLTSFAKALLTKSVLR